MAAESSPGAAVSAGVAAKDAWVESGELIGAQTLAQHWSVSPRALSIAVREQQLFAVVHRRRRYYPREFSLLGKATVAQVCRTMAGVPPWTQFIFWKRTHGALGGRTASEALSDQSTENGGVSRVLALARALAVEATSSDA